MRGPGLLALAFVLAATTTASTRAEAQAQALVVPVAENTRAACSDGLDNDGDGHVDCADQDCQDFTLCAQLTSGRADDLAKLRGRGTVRVVIGAVLLSMGVIAGGISALLWTAGTNSSSGEWYAGAGSLDGVGFLMIGGGTALLAIGAGNLAEARRPRLASDGNSRAGLTVRF